MDQRPFKRFAVKITDTGRLYIVVGQIVEERADDIIVELDKNIGDYPTEVQNVLLPINNSDNDNIIFVRKDSTLNVDNIKIVDKGGSNRRSKKSKKRRLERRNKTLKKRRRR